MKHKLSIVTQALILLALVLAVVTLINMDNRDSYITPKLECSIDSEVCHG